MMASQITGFSIVYSTVCSGADERNHQISASLACVSRSPVDSPHKGPEARKMFPCDDVIMLSALGQYLILTSSPVVPLIIGFISDYSMNRIDPGPQIYSGIAISKVTYWTPCGFWQCYWHGFLEDRRSSFHIWCTLDTYRKISNIRRTKFQNLNVSHLVLQLSLPNPWKPGVK